MNEMELWGEPIRRRQSVIINDYPACQLNKGYPQGHIPIQRYLSVPVMDGRRLVAVIAAGCKMPLRVSE